MISVVPIGHPWSQAEADWLSDPIGSVGPWTEGTFGTWTKEGLFQNRRKSAASTRHPEEISDSWMSNSNIVLGNLQISELSRSLPSDQDSLYCYLPFSSPSYSPTLPYSLSLFLPPPPPLPFCIAFRSIRHTLKDRNLLTRSVFNMLQVRLTFKVWSSANKVSIVGASNFTITPVKIHPHATTIHRPAVGSN